MRKWLLLISIFIASVPSAYCDLLKYTDSSGRVHFVDSISKVPEEYRAQTATPAQLPKITKYQGGSTQNDDTDSYRSTGAKIIPAVPNNEPVSIYVTSWCPHCKELESFLKAKNIKFKRYDIERDRRAVKAYQKLGGGGVPLVKIGDKVLRGFSPRELGRALGIR